MELIPHREHRVEIVAVLDGEANQTRHIWWARACHWHALGNLRRLHIALLGAVDEQARGVQLGGCPDLQLLDLRLPKLEARRRHVERCRYHESRVVLPQAMHVGLCGERQCVRRCEGE